MAENKIVYTEEQREQARAKLKKLFEKIKAMQAEAEKQKEA